MAHYYLGLGTNLGDCKANMECAVRLINERIGHTVALSSFVSTEPWGFESANRFLNAAICVESDMQPGQVLDAAKQIEKDMGRTQKSVGGVYHDRVIDIDILFCDNLVIESELLSIPHKLMHKRDFVLVPMAEIAPDFIHPVLKKSMSLLLKELQQSEKVNK